jgi:hypothetical protein
MPPSLVCSLMVGVVECLPDRGGNHGVFALLAMKKLLFE